MVGLNCDRFVDQLLAEELKCGICLDVVFEAVDTQCRHTFCYDCIEKWINRPVVGIDCPDCRHRLTKTWRKRTFHNQRNSLLIAGRVLVDRNRKVDAIVGKLNIRCDYALNGCHDVRPLESLSAHTQSCAHRLCRVCGHTLTGQTPDGHKCVDELKKVRDKWEAKYIVSQNEYHSLLQIYSQTSVARTPIPKAYQQWNQDWTHYKPTVYELDFSGKGWADPGIGSTEFAPKWHEMDGPVDRRSRHSVEYAVTAGGYPLNPLGRTGIGLRGVLGRWGPNHVAYAIITKWKRDTDRQPVIHTITERPVAQFVAIQCNDFAYWALPGGMIGAGESVDTALVREFAQKAFGNDVVKAGRLLGAGREIYADCVGDPRNTDNAWIEIVVKVYELSDDMAAQVVLEAGDDAVGAQWLDMSAHLKLYADQHLFVESVARLLDAHF